MDRRVVAGIVGVLLAGPGRPSPAQVGPDPSGLPPVGLAPLPSLGDTINGATGAPGRAAAPPSGVPTNPLDSGPPAAVPLTPIAPGPVGLVPEPPIGQSLRSGYRPGPAATAARSSRSTARPAQVPTRFAPASPATAPGPAPKVDPSAVPTALPDLLPGGPPALPAAPGGRPAPFAGRAPETPRPQAEPVPGGRPRPPLEDRPPAARPRGPASTAPSDRPAVAPAPPPDLAGVPPTIEADPIASTGPPPLPATAPAPTGPPAVDPAVTRVAREATAIKLKPDAPKELPFATLRAAAIGDDVITLDELNAVVGQRIEEIGEAAPSGGADRRQFVNMVASQALDHMIDQAVILQEANRRMRNPKAQTMFNDFVDKVWREEELPRLLRKTTSANEYEVRRKLADQGKSYEALKEAFRKKLLARDFLGAEIRNKVSCDLADLRAYYNDHLKDYDQPARFTWREIEVNVAKHPSRAAARQKAEALLARLLRAEDFDALARSASDGPTAAQGGLYPDMTPGSYGIPAVNDELNRLPVGQVSTILEGPNSFHVVRVESRREAGPLRFDEVQDKIRSRVMEANYQKAVESYLARLRSRTLIRTMFDNTASAPGLARRDDAAVRPASGR